MSTLAIGATFLLSAAFAVGCLWLHRRLAGEAGRPGCASMGAFVLSWVFGLSAAITGLFLLSVIFRR